MAEKMELVTDNSETSNPMVVGIGASAGGLKPLQDLFRALPTDLNMAYVVIQHLSPDYESAMEELLGRATTLPVVTAKPGMIVERGRVYLNPPGYEMELVDGYFRLAPFSPGLLRMPINTFLVSLARECGPQSVGVILSGTGSDGSQGVRQIRASGGMTVGQSPESAQFDGMPRNAIGTGCVDLIVEPGEVGLALQQHISNAKRNLEHLDSEEGNDPLNISTLFSMLSSTYGIDFSLYKPTTVARRIDRRLLLRKHRNLKEYLDSLQEDDVELDHLYHDLLIGVTRFFRDPDAFATLREQIRGQLIDQPPDGVYRVWSAGCATGEEAYSLAILLSELLREVSPSLQFKIFATDIHDRSLAVAAEGSYEEKDLAGLTQRQQGYFHKNDNGRRKIVSRIRGSIVFAEHDVVHDPPFTRIDLVVCRNLLIYLKETAQQSAISGFSFALKPGGLLMLGPSESISRAVTGFDCVDKEHRIFRRNHVSHRLVSHRLGKNSHRFDQGRISSLDAVKQQSRTEPSADVDVWSGLVSQLHQYAFLIDGQNRILFVTDGLKEWIHPQPSQPLLKFFKERSRILLAAGLAQALQKPGNTVIVNGLEWEDEISVSFSQAKISFLEKMGNGHSFGLVELILPETQDEAKARSSAAEYKGTRESLEEELLQTRESLGSTIVQLEAGNEELQAANEELIASNEELQATNEELQSVNEELHTVNIEHQRKVDELEQVTSDFNNLFNSTKVGSVLLDEHLNIRKFSLAASRYFNLLEHDIGRPLTDFASRLLELQFVEQMRNALKNHTSWSRYVRDSENHWLLIDVFPDRSENSLRGMILNITDVTELLGTEPTARTVFVVEQSMGVWEWHLASPDQIMLSSQIGKLLGRSAEPVLLEINEFLEEIAPAYRDQFQRELTLGDRKAARWEVAFQADASDICEVLASRWFDDQGRVERITGTIQKTKRSEAKR